jgi:hypothetical protein
MAVLNRVSGEAGERSINDLQFKPSLSGAASRAQTRAEIGIRDLGSLGGFRILGRMQKSNAVRGVGGFENERETLQRSNNATNLIVIRSCRLCGPSSKGDLRAPGHYLDTVCLVHSLVEDSGGSMNCPATMLSLLR